MLSGKKGDKHLFLLDSLWVQTVIQLKRKSTCEGFCSVHCMYLKSVYHKKLVAGVRIILHYNKLSIRANF